MFTVVSMKGLCGNLHLPLNNNRAACLAVRVAAHEEIGGHKASVTKV